MISDELPFNYPRLIDGDISLTRFLKALDLFDSPHKKLQNIIHIAGTNGKGSTSAFLKSILTEAGFRVNRFISPHLVSLYERIELSQTQISAGQFEHYHTIAKTKLSEHNIALSFFEMLTLIAFLAYLDHPADYIILETGLGGRLDATNVIENPLVTLITRIALDHQALLGNSLDQIAAEKAGIFKKGTPAFTIAQEPIVLDVLQNQANKLQVPLFVQNKEGSCIINDKKAELPGHKIFSYTPQFLTASYQHENAALAIAAAIHLYPNIDLKHIETGIKQAYHPGRFQKWRSVDGCQLWLDGAHNPNGAAALSKTLIDMKQKSSATKIALWPMLLSNRSFDDFLDPFQKHQIIDHFLPPPLEAKFTLMSEHDYHFADTVKDPFIKILHHSIQNGSTDIVICGSLYYIGWCLKNEHILFENTSH
ncbi:MAG: hypothetical protein KBE16_01510 [Alphaproteobacteria bacterium]|jgi:dihydrofolate synthase/folylpolyglutamate synthase|nr:hypothetical protein [Alphaproteobacteria bacterium]MBP9877685.1 hypothetical protein [Alphaproteobacteria bacterium]